MVQRWVFSALDTLFFRDGTPFHAGEGGYTGVRSLFPPSITTLQGVVRTSLALDHGWSPGRVLPAELGDAESLGDIQLYGPYVWVGDKPYFPLPLNILIRSGQSDNTLEFIRLRPGDHVTCDMGTVRLPAPVCSAQGAKNGEGYWVSSEGMSAILAGDVPSANQVLKHDKLWTEETRVGLERDNRTRTAVQGRLYNCAHVRPGKDTQLVVLVEGVPGDWTVSRQRVARMGGEGRLAGVSVDHIDAPEAVLPSVPDLSREGKGMRFTVTLVTPGWYKDRDMEKVIRHGPPGIPGRCVSACVGKPGLVGGWDLANNRPRPQQPVIPAGSTWFYESEEMVDTVASLHGCRLGGRSAFGFGQILVGRWEDSQ